MKAHTKTYLKYALETHGIDTHEIFCEITGRVGSTDINHIDARGMGGNPSKDKDRIENLMCITRELHTKLGDIKEHKPFLRQVHEHWMKTGRAWVQDFPQKTKKLAA